MSYTALNAALIVATVDRLHARVQERFAGRSIAQVCGQLATVAKRNSEQVEALQRPNLWVRAGVCVIAALLAVALVLLVQQVKLPNLVRLLQPGDQEGAMLALFQGVDSAVNVLLLFGAGLFFLLQHEERDKRAKALSDLYELRSIAHVIDMHQLTKDPTVLLNPDHKRTAASPVDPMSPFELVRYLDYCSEMLSLTAKVAALYAQGVRDPVIIETVSDLESMTTNLSRKIWQKISIVEQMSPSAAL